MNPLDMKEIGTTGLRVTRFGLGGAPFGSEIPTDVAEEVAVQTIQRGLQLGVRYFDTAPLYGRGKCEGYFGRALAGAQRDEFVLSTKVGHVLFPVDEIPDTDGWVDLPSFDAPFDFSRDGVLRSIEGSLQRLNLDRVDIALIHDPDEGESALKTSFGEPVHYRQAIDETYPVLAELQSQGVVKAIGVGMNQWQALARFARDGDFDCFLLAGRYTLLDQSGLIELLPLCEHKRISVILGGPYNSGILASDLSPGASYFYKEAPPEVLERARQIKAVCDQYGVPLKAAALQFGLAHPAVAATIPGAVSTSEVEENFSMAGYPIPDDLWTELRHEGLIPEEAPTPSSS